MLFKSTIFSIVAVASLYGNDVSLRAQNDHAAAAKEQYAQQKSACSSKLIHLPDNEPDLTVTSSEGLAQARRAEAALEEMQEAASQELFNEKINGADNEIKLLAQRIQKSADGFFCVELADLFYQIADYKLVARSKPVMLAEEDVVHVCTRMLKGMLQKGEFGPVTDCNAAVEAENAALRRDTADIERHIGSH